MTRSREQRVRSAFWLHAVATLSTVAACRAATAQPPTGGSADPKAKDIPATTGPGSAASVPKSPPILPAGVVTAVAGPKDLITSVPTTAFEIVDPMPAPKSDPSPRSELEVVVVADPDVTLNSVEVIDVTFGTRQEPQLSALIEPRWVAKKSHWTLALRLPLAALDEVGTYSVTLLASGTRNGKRSDQRIALQLARPAAQLQLYPSRLVLEQTFGWGWGPIEPGTVKIVETTRRRAATLRALDTGDGKHGDQRAGARLDLTIATPRLEPGSSLELPITLNGKLDAGTTSGDLVIDAPQLDHPVRLAYEIRTRISGVIVFLALIFGIGLGLLMRSVLPRVSARARLRAEIGRLRLAASVARKQSEDTEFGKKVTAIEGACNNKVRARDELQKLLDTQKRALQQAIDQLAADSAGVEAQLVVLESLVGATWTLPAAARSALAPLGAAVCNARDRLRVADPTGAKDKIDTPRKTAEAGLQAAIADLYAALVKLDATLTAALRANAWPSPVASVVTETLGLVKPRRDALAAYTATVTQLTLVAAVTSTHDTMQELRAGAARCDATAHMVSRSLAIQLARLGASADDLREFEDSLPGSLDEPVAFLGMLAERAPELAGRFATILVALAPKAATSIRDLVVRGSWSEAIGAADAEIAKEPQRKPAAAGAADGEPNAVFVGLGVASLPDVVIRHPAPEPRTETASPPTRTIEIAIERAEAVERRVNALGTVLSIGLAAAVYMIALSSQTIGTGPALFGVVLQGFTIDITVDGVIALIKQRAGGQIG